MSELLQTLLSTRGWLLADGAVGTNLFDMGLRAGEAPELWNDSHRQNILALHRETVAAGSDLFLTNSFGSNAARLRLCGAQKRAFELSRIAAELGREVADKSERKVIVAGSMGPTGDIMRPMGALTSALAVEMFHEQAEGLKAGGVDVLWYETFSAREEFEAAAEAARLADMAWCGTMSFETAGRTMMGLKASELVTAVAGFAHAPAAFGANCGTGASDLLRTILEFAAQGPQAPLIAKSNAGVPRLVEDRLQYDGTPEVMAIYATLARDCGATIIGGCCGTTPDHLRAMRDALEKYVPEPRPSLDRIAEALGSFSCALSDEDRQDDDRPRRSGRPRRRS